MKETLRIPCFFLPFLLAGCGTNVGEALLLAGESGARTLLDVWISDVYSDLPDLFTLPGGPGEPAGDAEAEPADGGADPGDGGAEPGGAQDGSGGELAGDPTIGAELFAGNSCSACHCEDASGGCVPGAPNIQGADFATILERLQGETAHPGGKFPELTEQDIADLQAFTSSG